MVPHVAGKGASFKGAALYYLHDKRDAAQQEADEPVLTSERVAFTETRNLPDDDPERAWRVMAHTAIHAAELKARAGVKATGRKATEGPVYSYSLAWHPEQEPTREEMIAAAEASLKFLRFENHQALFVAHNDEPQPHIHVIVNRVHPETGKTHNPYGDFRRFSRWAEGFEWEGGKIYCEQRVENNERRRAGMRVKDEISLDRADYEKQAAKEAKELKPASLVTVVARHHAYFTAEDLKREAENRTAAKPDEIVRAALDDPRLLKLYDDDGRHVAYTTRATRQEETDTLERAERMAGTMHHRVSGASMRAAMESRTLDDEQRAAMISALGPGGLKVIEGQAGTGKSYTMDAIAEAARRDGYHVTGLARTNPVASDMGASGVYSDTRSINSLMWWVHSKPDDPKARIDSKTMLMIDEAAMVETRLLDRVTKLAEERGAKVILVGHDRQLSAVEYGGLFTDIAARTGSVKLTNVRRQEEGWAREASSDMAEGRFDKALKAFDAHDKIDWQDGIEDSRAALVAQWSRDTAEARGNRFAFAYTNEEVLRLNAAMQEIEIDRGRVGNLATLEAHDGELVIGEGDRIAFKGTDKRRNILNGTLGTVESIEGTRLTVKADAGHTIRFDTEGEEAFNAFRLGYAGTIYSGQGKTLDQAYVLHTRHWRNASTYVALTRARADTKMFVAREELTGRRWGSDLDKLVRQVERQAYRGSSQQYGTEPPAHEREAEPAPDRKSGHEQDHERAAAPAPGDEPEPDRVAGNDDPERDSAVGPEDTPGTDAGREAEQRALDDMLKRAAEQLADEPPAPAEPSRDAEDEEMKPRPGLKHLEDTPPTQGQKEAAWAAERKAAIPAHMREDDLPVRKPEPERKPLPEGAVDRDAEGRPVYPSPEAERQYPNPFPPLFTPQIGPPPPDLRTLPADEYAEAVKAIQAKDAAAARALEAPQQPDSPDVPQALTQGDTPVAEDREKPSSAPAFEKAASPNQPEPQPAPDIEQTGSARQPRMAGPERFQPTGSMARQAAEVNHQVEMEADARRNAPAQQPPSPAPSGGADKQSLLDAFRAARDKHQDLSSQDRDGPGKDGPGHGHDGPDRKPKGVDFDR